jgi:hypothetical protein
MKVVDTTGSTLRKNQLAFDAYIDRIVAARQRDATRLSVLLDNFLQSWCDHQRALVTSDRQPDAVRSDKLNVAGHVRYQLGRANYAFLCDSQPTNLLAQANKKHRLGTFVLMPQKSSTPSLTRSDLQDILDYCRAGNRKGLTLVEPALWGESAADWRTRVGIKTNRTGRAPIWDRL